jgi:hypothetical protein
MLQESSWNGKSVACCMLVEEVGLMFAPSLKYLSTIAKVGSKVNACLAHNCKSILEVGLI